jgi:hypothetical protein
VDVARSTAPPGSDVTIVFKGVSYIMLASWSTLEQSGENALSQWRRAG